MPDATWAWGRRSGSVILAPRSGDPVGGRRRHRLWEAARRLDVRQDSCRRRCSTDGSRGCEGDAFPPDSVAGMGTRRRCACRGSTTSMPDAARPRAGGRAARHAGVGQPFRRAARDQRGADVDPAALRTSAGAATSSRASTRRSTRRLHAGCRDPLEDPELASPQRGLARDRPFSRDLAVGAGYAERAPGLGSVALRHAPARGRRSGRAADATDEVNCHHDCTEPRTSRWPLLWITRKGAIRARGRDREA